MNNLSPSSTNLPDGLGVHVVVEDFDDTFRVDKYGIPVQGGRFTTDWMNDKEGRKPRPNKYRLTISGPIGAGLNPVAAAKVGERNRLLRGKYVKTSTLGNSLEYERTFDFPAAKSSTR